MPQWLAQADPAGGGRGELLAHADPRLEEERGLLPQLLTRADEVEEKRNLMRQLLAQAVSTVEGDVS